MIPEREQLKARLEESLEIGLWEPTGCLLPGSWIYLARTRWPADARAALELLGECERLKAQLKALGINE